jgi:hypothetical protein
MGAIPNWLYNISMNFAVVFLAAILPALIWILFIRWWDRHEPEPPLLLAKLFLAGIAIYLAVFAFNVVLQSLFVSAGFIPPFASLSRDDNFILIAISALLPAIIQQIVTLWAAIKLIHHEKYFTEPVDGIVYLFSIAVGSAITENIMVFFIARNPLSTFNQTLFQAIFTSLMLGICGGIMGLTLGNKKFHKTGRMYVGVIAAISIHSIYKFFIISTDYRLAGVVVIVAAIYLFTRFSYAIPMKNRLKLQNSILS